jgi:FAD/FMN-containing dehydrogenase
MGTEILNDAVHEVRARLQGELVMPEDSDWDVARQAWNLAADQRPSAVALPETAADVVEIVRFARAHGYRVAAQGTGHNALPLGDLEGTVLVKLARMRGVEIDPDERIARVQAGALWQEVTDEAVRHGLVGLAGSSPDVGVVGYSLGGGISWLARKHGFSANSVVAIELVTANGRHVRTDAQNEPELFWALRGGGGSFGVVTAVEIKLYPVAEVYAGWLIFPQERGREVLTAWREWVDTVPEEVTSVGRYLNIPTLPDIPEEFRGASIVVVEAAMLLDEAEGAKLLEPLRALGPVGDTFAVMPAGMLSKLHMDPEAPVPGKGDGTLLADVTPETIAALDAAAGAESGSTLLSVEVRHLGGAIGRSAPEHGAVDRFDARFVMFAVGLAPTAELMAVTERDVRFVLDSLEPWYAGQTYLNFTESKVHSRSHYRPETHRRLRRVKAMYDPQDIIRSNHPIEPLKPPAQKRQRPQLRRLPRSMPSRVEVDD